MRANNDKKGLKYHLAAVFVVFAWGISFVNTKILLDHGLTPGVIYVHRFSLAYIMMLVFAKFKVSMFALADETLAALCGLFGGTIYFVAENTALGLTLVTNVAFVVNSTPLLTALVISVFDKGEKFTMPMMLGAVIALSGVALLVFQDGFVIGENSWGAILAFLAASSWAIYSLFFKKLERKYPVSDVTRKVFLYGIISSLLFITADGERFDINMLKIPEVSLNLAILGLVCSLLCFYLWNRVVKELGAIRTSNYLYLSPIVSVLASMAVLGESLRIIGVIGCILIFTGVLLAEKKHE